MKAKEPTEYTIQFNDPDRFAAFKLACGVGAGLLDIADVDVSHQASAGDDGNSDDLFEVLSFGEALSFDETCGGEYEFL